MILYVTPQNRHSYRSELNQYFKLRKKIFSDKLKWVRVENGEMETDRFDTMFNVYILHIDTESGKISGGVRLMPTTGPTLLHSVWQDMLPHKDDFRSPNIWEATRFCVDEDISTRKSNLLNRTTLSLSMAVADFGHANGISNVIAVCEDYFFNMAGAYGPQAEIVSTKFDENGLKISCGIWSTSSIQSMLTWSRALTGNSEPAIIREVA
ncbi:MAG: acyl-homoserine-lactone synthase [Salaquimonas sp.]